MKLKNVEPIVISDDILKLLGFDAVFQIDIAVGDPLLIAERL